MAENDSSQEKSLDATPEKIRKARKKGDIFRSKELGSALAMLGTALGLKLFIPMMATHLEGLLSFNLRYSHKALFDNQRLLAHIGQAFCDFIGLVLPMLLLLKILSIAGGLLIGGLNFSAESLKPSAKKINPLSGFKRMFGMKSLVELVKSFFKVLLVCFTLYFVMRSDMPTILSLNRYPLDLALLQFNQLLWHGFFIMSLSLVLIAVLEIPYQRWEYYKKLRMTVQEAKDEYKEIEGKPEVKAQLRRRQKEMSRRRISQAVQDSNAVFVNPTHYAVAIRYKPEKDAAPVLVAKGVDFMAEQIRQEAQRHKTMVLTIPDLTRSIYYTTKLDQSIPVELYHAVALILVYVKRINEYQGGRGVKPSLPHYVIPDYLQY